MEILSLDSERAIYKAMLYYTRGIDRCDADLIRKAYHPDATDDHGSFKGGVEEFIQWVIPALKDNFSATQHNISNVYIEVDGDGAKAESYVQAIHTTHKNEKDEQFLMSVGGRYLDRFECRNGEWKILHRQIIIDWSHTTKLFNTYPKEGQTEGKRGKDDPGMLFFQD